VALHPFSNPSKGLVTILTLFRLMSHLHEHIMIMIMIMITTIILKIFFQIKL